MRLVGRRERGMGKRRGNKEEKSAGMKKVTANRASDRK